MKMKKVFAVFGVLVCVALASTVFGQVNSSIGGTVEDASKALIPGATVIATNTQTGVENKTITNESGAYNFPVLQPGDYKLSASLPGFKTTTYSGVELRQGEPLRRNFALEVGNVSATVDVSVGADSVLAATGASIGEVLSEKRIADLPLVSNDILDLARILPGFRESPGGSTLDTFAGTGPNSVNVTRDGVSVNDGRYSTNDGIVGIGITTTTAVNPDLVGEIRLILTPVDAELGRGNTQIQITTRSGTNRFTGSAVWNIRNTALDPNTWDGNRTGAIREWYNFHEYTASYGGPIIKSKTFFFALWDQRIRNERSIAYGTVLTDTARSGVFRYLDGWNPGYAGQTPTAAATGPTTSATRVFPSVDLLGNPLLPGWDAGDAIDNRAYSGRGLVCYSVFGNQVIDPATGGMRALNQANDCNSGGLPVTWILPPGSTTTWDPNRTTIDTTGYIYKNLLQQMPQANYFGQDTTGTNPDGLNVATHRWLRTRKRTGSTTITDGDDDLKQFNLKIDHYFTTNHKVNGSWSTERNSSASGSADWPNGIAGEVHGLPQVFAVNMTSTLGPSMVNEAKFGLRYNKRYSVLAPYTTAGEQAGLTDYLLTSGPEAGFTRAPGQTAPVFFSPGVAYLLGGPYGFGGADSTFNRAGSNNGNVSKLFTFGDTLSWTKGTHAFKVGGEYRPTSSRGYGLPGPNINAGGPSSTTPSNPSPLAASATTGTFAEFAQPSTTCTLCFGPLTTTRNNSSFLLYTLAATVESVSGSYWIDNFEDLSDGKWQSSVTQPYPIRTLISNEMSVFVKDDWKLTRNLTLNLGVRWEYYGAPYIKEGLTTTPVGRGDGIFGVGRNVGTSGLFDSWLVPGGGGAAPIFLSGYGTNGSLACVAGVNQGVVPTSTCDGNNITNFEFLGPNSPNPSRSTIRNDNNNFGPAIGFAYQIPWLKRTAVRGGYSLQYGGAGRSTSTLSTGASGIFGTSPGSTSGVALLNTRFPNTIFNLNDIAAITPAPPLLVTPGSPLPIHTRNTTAVTAYANDFATPYTQNFNFSVTTNLARNLTLDLRYVGTQSRKLQETIDLNTNNIYYNKELLDALEVTRAGGDAPLLTQMLAGLNLNTGVAGGTGLGSYAAIGTTNTSGVYQTGSAHLRRNATFNANLVNGNFLAVANSLATLSPAASGTTGVTGYAGNSIAGSGRLIRNGCDRIANTGATSFGTGLNVIQLRCFPENYLITNPQLGTANYVANSGSANYHSMETQITLRPTHGFSVQSTYTWSKSLLRPGNGTQDVRNRQLDYGRTYASTASDLRTNGTIELPIGPDKLLFGNASGWVARLIEGWQTSLIMNIATGAPRSILAGTGLNYGSSTSTTVGGNITPDVVGPWNIRKGEVQWDGAINQGSYFGNELLVVDDPQCNVSRVDDTMGYNMGTQVTCNLNAIARPLVPTDPLAVLLSTGATGQYLLVNPKPGKVGTLGQKTIEAAGPFRFDANVQKKFRISESKSFQLRVDATNILNHPTAGAATSPGSPSFTMNDGTTPSTFGLFTTKSGSRSFRAQLRLTF